MKCVQFIALTLLCLAVVPFVSADIMSDAKECAVRIEEFIQDSQGSIVMGDDCSKAERMALAFLKEQYPHISGLDVVTESEFVKIGSGEAILVIGGPYQNDLARSLLEDANNTIVRDDLSVGIVHFITTPEGMKYIIFSDKAGFGNVPHAAASSSPLARIMPEAYVPAAATAVSFSLLWLWRFLAILFKKIGRLILSAKIMSFVRKKELKKEYKGKKIFGVRFKLREWLSISLAATVFALSVSYMYLSKSSGMYLFLLVNILVNLVVYAIRHSVRLYMDKHYTLHTEYVFWYWGAFVTIISGWLGNTFALSGYTVSDKTDKKHFEGHIQYIINFWTFIASLVFMVLNFLWPSVFLQMVMVLSLAISVIQMLPLVPFGGKKVYEWKKTKWWLLFVPMAIVYIILNIII